MGPPIKVSLLHWQPSGTLVPLLPIGHDTAEQLAVYWPKANDKLFNEEFPVVIKPALHAQAGAPSASEGHATNLQGPVKNGAMLVLLIVPL